MVPIAVFALNARVKVSGKHPFVETKQLWLILFAQWCKINMLYTIIRCNMAAVEEVLPQAESLSAYVEG